MSKEKLSREFSLDDPYKNPAFCQYSNGACVEDFSGISNTVAFFIYSSEKAHISESIRETVNQLRNHSSKSAYNSWEDLDVSGKIIFCEICKKIRSANIIFADITTLNFNVLFEIGFALGLGKQVVPIRDSSYEQGAEIFEQMGIFDVLGYESYTNSQDLVSIVNTCSKNGSVFKRQLGKNKLQPIYLVRSPYESNASIKITSTLKKGYYGFREFDSKETPRLSYHDAYSQVQSSYGVIGHLLDPERAGASVHNARCAFVAGLAMSSNKKVLLFQEGAEVKQPVDYRDIVLPYTSVSHIQHHMAKFLDSVVEAVNSSETEVTKPKNFLETIDVGDVAAENEVQSLKNYFLKTPHFQNTAQGHARLVIGRKGSGKTAMFYAVKNIVQKERHALVVDLKPEGHQFVRLREIVLMNLTKGMQLQLLTAFWNYLLTVELAKRLLEECAKSAWRDPSALEAYRDIEAVYDKHSGDSDADFSERLLTLVDKVINEFELIEEDQLDSAHITNLIYNNEIKLLGDAIRDYPDTPSEIWLLVDNLDKGLPSRGATVEDIAILSCLMEASRKLQRSFQKRDVNLHSVVFLRKDIYDFLIEETSDRGKESVANIDWSDIELLKQLISKRLAIHKELIGDFQEVWPRIAALHVDGENSFNYILKRTFLRPRDLLNLLRKSLAVAVSREHQQIEEDDIKTAEKAYSEDMLNDLKFEIRDVVDNFPNLMPAFLGMPHYLSRDDLSLVFDEGNVSEGKFSEVLDVLLWFCFIGVRINDEEIYAHDLMYNLEKLKNKMPKGDGSALIYSIHPALRQALESSAPDRV